MFSGEFEYRIDEKGRVPIPPRFRKDLAGGVVLSFGPDFNIMLYPAAEWDKIAAKLSSTGSLEPRKLRRLKRAIFGTAFPTELDGQGRVALPAKLREYAGIENDIMVVGVNNALELWSKKAWQDELSGDIQESWQIIESMEK